MLHKQSEQRWEKIESHSSGLLFCLHICKHTAFTKHTHSIVYVKLTRGVCSLATEYIIGLALTFPSITFAFVRSRAFHHLVLLDSKHVFQHFRRNKNVNHTKCEWDTMFLCVIKSTVIQRMQQEFSVCSVLNAMLGRFGNFHCAFNCNDMHYTHADCAA